MMGSRRVYLTDKDKEFLEQVILLLQCAGDIMRRLRDEAGDRGREMIRKDANDLDGVYSLHTSDLMQEEAENGGDLIQRLRDCIDKGFYDYTYDDEDGDEDPDFEAWLGQQEQEARDRAWEG